MWYQAPITRTPTQKKHEVADTAKGARLIQALYGWPSATVWLQAETSAEDELLVLSVWEQQWASLRSRFSFSTGSLAPRSRDGKKLDLQVVPFRAASSWNFEKSAREVSIEGPRPGCWANRCAAELGNQDGPSTRYLHRVGLGGRESFEQLVEILIEAEGATSAPELTIAFQETRRLRAKHRGPVVRFLLETPSVELSDAERLLGLVRSGLLQDIDDPAELDLEAVARRATASRVQDGLEIARLSRADFVGESSARHILSGVAGGLQPNDLLHLIDEQDWSVLASLLDQRPALGSSPQLWQTSRSTQDRLLHLLRPRLTGDSTDRVPVIEAVVEAGSRPAAELAAQWWPVDVIVALLDFVDAHESLTREAQDLSFLLSASPRAVASWLTGHPSPSSHLLLLIAYSLEPEDVIGLGIDDRQWLSMKPDHVESLDAVGFRALAFVYCLGLRSADEVGSKLLGVAFDTLYRAAEESRMPWLAWQLLERRVPTLGLFKDWDRCERLVRAVADSIVQYRWPDRALLAISPSPWIQRKLMRAIVEREHAQSSESGRKRRKGPKVGRDEEAQGRYEQAVADGDRGEVDHRGQSAGSGHEPPEAN
jgi:hypothetical protein